MLAYIYSWIYPEVDTQVPAQVPKQLPKKVCEKDLLNVKLKPVNTVKPIKPANPFTLQSLSKEQLDNILAVKLKKTNINTRQTYEPRHPVLRELMKLPKN